MAANQTQAQQPARRSTQAPAAAGQQPARRTQAAQPPTQPEGEATETKQRASSLSPEEKAERIEVLLEDLANTQDQNEKRKIRSKLRTLGHSGGLNQPRTPPQQPATPAAPAAPAQARRPAAQPAAPAASAAQRPARRPAPAAQA